MTTLALFALGFTTTVAQVLLVRELVAVFYGNELLLGLILAAWLAWGAVGAWLAGRRWFPHRRWFLAGGLVLLGGLPTLQMLLARGARAILRVPPGALAEFGPMVGMVALTIAPACLLGGVLFPLLTRRLSEMGRSPGSAYLWECAGAATGGVLFSFVFIHLLDPFQTAALLLLVNLTVAVTFTRPRFLRPASRLLPPASCFLPLAPSLLLLASCFLLLASCLLLTAPIVHRATLRWQWSDLVFAADSPYGRIVIQARDSQRIFYENGLLMFETQGTRPEEVVHPPFLAHPAPEDVLLIGGTAAGNLREILRHPVVHVTCVELDPLLIRAARLHLPPDEAAVLGDPRVSLILADGRRFVQTTSRTFDVVILDLPEPSTGALNRFYTEEFFREVRAILNPGGILALGLPSAENYWSPELARRNGSIYHTLRAVFSHVLVIPGDTNFFLASADPIRADPDRWGERLAERGVATRWVTADYLRYLFTTDRFAQVQGMLERMAGVRLNRDLTPVCYYYDLAFWLSRFTPRLRPFFERTDGLWLGWVALALIVPVALALVRRRWAVPLTVAGAGLAGMTLEMVALLAFQVRHGSLYAQVSLIVTAYMVGMVMGSRWAAVHRWSVPAAWWALRALMGAMVPIAVLLPFLLPFPLPVFLFPLVTLLVGGWGGAVFPLAMIAEGGEVARTTGRLYGADLVGGCLGALLGGTVFVPLLGIPQTCWVIALVAAAGGIALIRRPSAG